MWNQKLMWVVWPAFLAACILELVVFAMVDPQDMTWEAGRWRCRARAPIPSASSCSGRSP